jgi:hypothetical protein
MKGDVGAGIEAHSAMNVAVGRESTSRRSSSSSSLRAHDAFHSKHSAARVCVDHVVRHGGLSDTWFPMHAHDTAPAARASAVHSLDPSSLACQELPAQKLSPAPVVSTAGTVGAATRATSCPRSPQHPCQRGVTTIGVAGDTILVDMAFLKHRVQARSNPDEQ